MKCKLTVINIETGIKIDNEDLLMTYADLNLGCRFEAIGIQDDGTPVVFDRCGNFSYLDVNKYRVSVMFSG